jgi:hypothetical protein
VKKKKNRRRDEESDISTHSSRRATAPSSMSGTLSLQHLHNFCYKHKRNGIETTQEKGQKAKIRRNQRLPNRLQEVVLRTIGRREGEQVEWMAFATPW